MKKRIPIGIVGLNFGRHIIDQLQDTSDGDEFQIVAVCDHDTPRVKAMAERLGVRAYSSLDEFLADSEIVAVGLFTGPLGRANLIHRIIHADKDVITTKPFENDPKAALKILREAARLGRIVHLNSPAALLAPDLKQIQQWRLDFDLGLAVGARGDVWASYREQADGTWYDDPQKCPVAPIFRLGIYLINDLVQIFGPAQTVQVMHSRLFDGRPTPDNAQLGIRFQNGGLANIFASFCVDDGDHYRNSLTLNFERGTIYRNTGARRMEHDELVLVMNVEDKRTVVARTEVTNRSGQYQWDAFARAVRGEKLDNTVTPEQVVAGLQIIEAMAEADAGNGVAQVRNIEA